MGWRDEDTQIVTTQLSLASVTCSCYTRKLQTVSLNLPLPFASLQAWSREGHTHLAVLPLLQWELGSAIIKIRGNPIITKAYGPLWAGCEKSTTQLTRQAMGNTGGQNYKGNGGKQNKKSTTEGKNEFCQSLGMTSRKNALVRIMVGGCWDIPKGSSKTLSGMSLLLTTQPICLYSDEHLQLHTHQPRVTYFVLHLYSKGPWWRTNAATLMANKKWLNGTLASPLQDTIIPTAVPRAGCTSGAVITAGRLKNKLKTRQPYFLTTSASERKAKWIPNFTFCFSDASLYYVQWFACLKCKGNSVIACHPQGHPLAVKTQSKPFHCTRLLFYEEVA